MDYTRSFAISAAGMNAERTRVEVASLNLANAHTVITPGGLGFQPMRVVAQSVSANQCGSFASRITTGLDGGAETEENLPLPVITLEPTGATPKSVHEPGNPFSDAKGYVQYPAVDTATEMIEMMSALRAYEANVVAMNTARTLAQKALEIGG